MEVSGTPQEVNQVQERPSAVLLPNVVERPQAVGGGSDEITSPAAIPEGYPTDLPHMDPEIAALIEHGMTIPMDQWKGGIVPHPFVTAESLSKARHEHGPDAQIRH
jgi:hypothetical protein